MSPSPRAQGQLKTIFEKLYPHIDATRLLRHTGQLWQAELGQTFDSHLEVAGLVAQKLEAAGCEQVERIAFPADGKTVYQDKTMPMAWRATQGRLEVTKSAEPFAHPLIADYEKHPFHLIKGSVSTPQEGLCAPLIREEDMDAGADVRGAFVLLDPADRPESSKLRRVCSAGALGLISDNLAGRYQTPEAIQWVNACTHGPSWHVRADDPPFLGYTVSPVVGDQLRNMLRKGPVEVRAFSDGERYEGEIEVVTGVIPGEEPYEVWIMAHLYEPMADDNSSGVASALEIAHALQSLYRDSALPRPRFSIRFLFGMETYGFSAYAERRGGWLGDEVLCALNLDTLPILKSDREVDLCLSQSTRPSAGDYVLERLCKSRLIKTPLVYRLQTEGVYGDDRALACSTVGVPTLWMRASSKLASGAERRLWHNSAQTMERICPHAFRDITALCATWVAALLAPKEHLREYLPWSLIISQKRLESECEDVLCLFEGDSKNREQLPFQWLQHRLEIESARLRDFIRYGVELAHVSHVASELSTTTDRLLKRTGISERSESDATFSDRVWEVADTILITRKTRGLPHDQASVPPAERRLSLAALAYGGPLVSLLTHCDGQKTVADLLLYAQWEERRFYSPREVRKCLGELQHLAAYGYLDLRCSKTVTHTQLVDSFRNAGIKKGDLLLLHSGLSALGIVEGGAQTVIQALLEVLGSKGTLLLPTFTHSILCFERGPSLNRQLVPFHKERGPTWVGTIAETFRKLPGVLRSAHLSHSAAGIGPLAEECLMSHAATDAPAGPTSPWPKLHEHRGKIAFLGAGLGSCTFLHYLETTAGLPYLESSICVYEEDGTGRRLATVPKNFAGPRDFYGPNGEYSKIFCWLSSRGLDIQRTTVGFGELKVIDAESLFQLGMEAIQHDPSILL